jgi:hypothetical protein
LHGDKDTIVKYLHGRILGYFLDKKKLLYKFITCKNKNHNDFFINNNKIYEEIRQYISFCTGISYNRNDDENEKKENNINNKIEKIDNKEDDDENDKNINYNKENMNKIKNLLDNHFKAQNDNEKIKKIEKRLENIIDNLKIDDLEKNENEKNNNTKTKNEIVNESSDETIREESIYFVDNSIEKEQ